MKILNFLLCLILLSSCTKQNNTNTITTTSNTTSTTPISTITTTIEKKPVPVINQPQYGEIYAHITCERLKLDKDIYYGDDEVILKKALGQYDQSHLFGEGDVILIAGHNGTHLKAIHNVEVDDVLIVTTNYGTFTYEVDETIVRKASSFQESELHAEHEQLIIYTCYPFYSLNTDERFFVYASLIDAVYSDYQ